MGAPKGGLSTLRILNSGLVGPKRSRLRCIICNRGRRRAQLNTLQKDAGSPCSSLGVDKPDVVDAVLAALLPPSYASRLVARLAERCQQRDPDAPVPALPLFDRFEPVVH